MRRRWKWAGRRCTRPRGLGGGGAGSRRWCIRGLFWPTYSSAPHLQGCHCYLEGFLSPLSLSPSQSASFLSPFLSLPFDYALKKNMKQVHEEVKMRNTKCMGSQIRLCKWLCSAKIYTPISLCMSVCTYVHYVSMRSQKKKKKLERCCLLLFSYTALLQFVTLHCPISPWGSLKFHHTVPY